MSGNTESLLERIDQLEQILAQLDAINADIAAIHVDIAILELCDLAEIERPDRATKAA